MKIKILFCCILVIFTNLTALAQIKKKTKRNPKVPSISAVVTIKAEEKLSPLPKLPDESDKGIWNNYKNDEFKFSADFPSKVEDVLGENNVQNLHEFSVETNSASYRIMVQRIAANLDNQAVDSLLEGIWKDIYDSKKSNIINRRNIYLRLGQDSNHISLWKLVGDVARSL